MYPQDLVKVTCRLFKLLDPKLEIALEEWSLPNSKPGDAVIKYSDGALLQCGKTNHKHIIDTLLKMQYNHLLAGYDARVFLQFIQLALLFKTPDSTYMRMIFFPEEGEVRNIPDLPRTYTLLSGTEATVSCDLQRELDLLTLTVAKGASQRFANWREIDVSSVANTVGEYQRDRVRIFTDYIKALMLSAANCYQSPRAVPQNILQRLKAVAQEGFIPAAETDS